MGPTFESLRPPFRKLDEANAAVLPVRQGGRADPREAGAPVRARGAAVPAQPRRGVEGPRHRRARTSRRAFRGLNRLFNIGAYNPGGTEGISENCEKNGACTRAERARNESYLYWLAWVGQNTVSLFSTADALGPIRRAYLLNLNCDVFTAGAKDVGVPDDEAEGLADLYSGIGACANP